MDKIFRLTETNPENKPEANEQLSSATKKDREIGSKKKPDDQGYWKKDEASKIILTGFQVSF